jgi:DNA-binding transcriptional regulator YiaG
LAHQVSSKYHPAQTDEIEARPSLISEPLPPDNVIPLRRSRSLRAVLAESLNTTRALLRQLEDGVSVSNDANCEVVRLLFVATRQQVQALNTALECDDLE